MPEPSSRPARPPAHLPRDLRATDAFRDVQAWYEAVHKPGFGRPSHVQLVVPNPVDDRVALVTDVRSGLDDRPRQRVALLAGGDITLLDDTGHDQPAIAWSPDGRTLAWLVDRAEEGVTQAVVLRDGAATAEPVDGVEGIVEWLTFSPDGSRLLLGVAEPGADRPGAGGSGTVAAAEEPDLPDWLPEVEGPTRTQGWRRAVVVDLTTGAATPAGRPDLCVWEACWAGPDGIVAICSDGDPGEGAWYTADLRRIDLADGTDRVLHRPDDQLGLPTATADGRRVAVVEAVCSDRGIIAGDLLLLDVDDDAPVRRVDTGGVDVTALRWVDDRLGYAGLRGLDTVAGLLDPDTGQRVEQLAAFVSTGRRYPDAAWRSDGTAVLLRHAYDIAPEVVTVAPDGGEPTVLASLRHAGADVVRTRAGCAEAVSWTAPDGLQVQGILMRPDGDGPFPLVVNVHGGPIWAYTNSWEGFYGWPALFAAEGFAVLHPNPRGSGGRGQAFARHVVGDMGGLDTLDYLAGVDALVERGLVDPDRVCVTGGSYGGFMTAWLITQDQRWAAAAPVAPVTDWYSQHGTSNLQAWDHTFLDRDPRGQGLFHERSPVMHADRVVTPTLSIAGLEDRCTPPTQAVELHRALQEVGVETHLALYPGEGHGVRGYPAQLDYVARLLTFFRHHTRPASA